MTGVQSAAEPNGLAAAGTCLDVANRRPRVAIAISAFRSDAAVIALIERIREEEIQYDWLFVVDSCGSGVLRTRIEQWNEARIGYHGSDQNLGSAGNLGRRFEIAMQLGADAMLALNHDAAFSRVEYEALHEAMATSADIGAVYPMRYELGRGRFDISGTRRFPWKFHGTAEIAAGSMLPAYWGSSNGALYSLEPARRGLVPDQTLWMGWEDYAYGIDLHAAGWSQYLVERARKDDTYEYCDRRFMGINVTTADKPAWYFFYGIRNLTLLHLHSRRSLRGLAFLALWAPVYAARIVLFPARAGLLQSISYFAAGLFHGLLNRRGKWRLPG